MEKRVFLAIVLSLIVLTAYQYYFQPAPQPAPVGAAATSSSGTAAATTSATGSAATPAQAPVAPAAVASAPAAAAVVSDTAEHEIQVDTDTVSAVFSTKGAVLKSWRLKSYAIDLVPENLPAIYAKPFALTTDDPAQTATLRNALFRPSSTDAISAGASTATLSFEYQDASGLSAKKTFTIQPGGTAYMLGVDASVQVNGADQPFSITWGPALGYGYSLEGSRYAYPPAVVQFRNGASVERLTAKNITDVPAYDGTWTYAGVGDQYFLSAAVPKSLPMSVDYHAVELPIPNGPDPKKTRTFIDYSVRPHVKGMVPFFLGPKDFDLLKGIEPDLVRAINFGFFAPLVVPLMQALKWLNRYIHNWGFSIIALTAIINLLIFPLRHRSMVSMRKMQSLQPQVKAIQDRYAKYKVTDPERQKMNTEMMALYKEKGVNPASGCVPMLLTMPILFAFYGMLAASIELRGAPFVGWIHDLSIHDPYFITPVVMAATMFWQQRMMPSTGDPMQQKLFLIMPLVFMIGFLWAPAGLVLYWLMSNMMAIGQQYATNRIIGAPANARVIKAKQLPKA